MLNLWHHNCVCVCLLYKEPAERDLQMHIPQSFKILIAPSSMWTTLCMGQMQTGWDLGWVKEGHKKGQQGWKKCKKPSNQMLEIRKINKKKYSRKSTDSG